MPVLPVSVFLCSVEPSVLLCPFSCLQVAMAEGEDFEIGLIDDDYNDDDSDEEDNNPFREERRRLLRAKILERRLVRNMADPIHGRTTESFIRRFRLTQDLS